MELDTEIRRLNRSSRLIDTARSQHFIPQGRSSQRLPSVEQIDDQWEDYWPAFVATVPTYGHPAKTAAYGASLSPQVYSEGVEIQRKNWDRFQRIFSEHDLLLSPTVSFVAPEIEEWDRNFREPQRHRHGNYLPTYAANTHIFSILGWPALSVPCGMVDGLPVGLQIIGKPDREPFILRAADALLRAFPWDRRPTALPVAR